MKDRRVIGTTYRNFNLSVVIISNDLPGRVNRSSTASPSMKKKRFDDRSLTFTCTVSRSMRQAIIGSFFSSPSAKEAKSEQKQNRKREKGAIFYRRSLQHTLLHIKRDHSVHKIFRIHSRRTCGFLVEANSAVQVL